MTQEFNLTLCHYTRYCWLAWAGTMAALLAALTACQTLLPASWGAPGMFLFAVPFYYGVWLLLKWLTLYRVQVVVGPAGLLMCPLAAGPEITVGWGEVLSYRNEQLRHGRELRLWLRSGQRITLTVNYILRAAGGYEEMLQAVERAIAAHNRLVLAATTRPAVITRDKSFYEKSAATVLLVVFGTVVLLGSGRVLWPQKPLVGSLIAGLGALLAYAGLRCAARVR